MTLQQAQPLFKEWQRITHKPLGELLLPTWLCDGEALPDLWKMEKWLDIVGKDVSVKATIIERYGQRASEILKQLIDSYTTKTNTKHTSLCQTSE